MVASKTWLLKGVTIDNVGSEIQPVKEPNSDHPVSIAPTIHSESETSVPLALSQLSLGPQTVGFLVRVWSLVAWLTPATSHPPLGLPFQSPSQSKIVNPVISPASTSPSLLASLWVPPLTSANPSSPLLKNWKVMSALSKIVWSACGWAITKTSPASIVEPSGNVFQNSYSPCVEGSLLTFGKA